jgi:hypothetical protein
LARFNKHFVEIHTETAGTELLGRRDDDAPIARAQDR